MRTSYDSAIRPPAAVEELIEVFRYRELVLQLIGRSVKTRYKRSVLGVGWTMLSPLLSMVVLTLVFSKIFRFEASNYALFVLAGLLGWNFFSQVTTASMGDLIWSGGLITSIYVPKAVFAIAAAGTGVVNLTLGLVPYLIISFLVGGPPGPHVILFVPALLSLTMITLGVALAVSSWGAYFPDLVPMYEVLLLAWMYLTPVIYPLSSMPDNVAAVLKWNPMVYPLSLWRAAVYGDSSYGPSLVVTSLLIGVVAVIAGWLVFSRRSRELAYHV